MRTFVALTSLLGFCASAVQATALTYRLEAHEKACFFANTHQQGTKVAFYFAILVVFPKNHSTYSIHRGAQVLIVRLQVQAGGSFDVDYEVVGPNEKVILDGQKERQGDFVFTAQDPGEYRFCFNNEMSTFAEKTVDFEIAVENESRNAQLPSKQGSSPEQTSVLEESILKLSAQLSTISRNQKYFRTRENRNFSTVRSTERRIFNFSLIEGALMVTMAGLQVFIVRFFFQGARKGYV